MDEREISPELLGLIRAKATGQAGTSEVPLPPEVLRVRQQLERPLAAPHADVSLSEGARATIASKAEQPPRITMKTRIKSFAERRLSKIVFEMSLWLIRSEPALTGLIGTETPWPTDISKLPLPPTGSLAANLRFLSFCSKLSKYNKLIKKGLIDRQRYAILVRDACVAYEKRENKLNKRG